MFHRSTVLPEAWVRVNRSSFLWFNVITHTCTDLALESNPIDGIKERVHAWNELLIGQANDFAKGSDKATVFVFSSHRVLTEVLGKPVDFDFAEEDAETECAGIWADDLHVTPAVHAILAERLLDSLINSR